MITDIFKQTYSLLGLMLILCITAYGQDYSPEELTRLVEENQKQVITDEDFFGKYDTAANDWVVKPMLNYALPKLRAVSYTARKGDYETASKQLLDYYRNRDFKRQAIPDSWNKDRVSLLMDNIIGFDQQEKFVTVFEINKSPAEYALNVTNSVSQGMVTFMLMGRHKNEAVSYVWSREAEVNKPVLELLTGDKWTAYIACADVYVRAGKYEKQNYGGDARLEICNSGVTTGRPFDDNTRRALISFDLSKVDIKTVKQARLKLYAYSENESDKLILWRSYPTVVNERTDSWSNMLGYQYSWENVPGGVEWTTPQGGHSQYRNWTRRMYWLGDMATCAVRSGDFETAKKTIALLRDFIEEYNYQPRPWGELNAGLGRLPNLCKYVPYLFDSEAMTGRDCVEILKFLCKEGEYMMLNPSKLVRDNLDNMGMSIVAAITTLSITFPELADAKIWQADSYERTDKLMNYLVLNDGAYTEHTMGYPFAVLGMMLDLLEFCDGRGVKLPDSFAPKTLQLAKYMMNVSMPDGIPPAWGEGGPRNTKTNDAVKRAAKHFNDKELVWWCGLTEKKYTPQYSSVHYPDAKIVMFRSDWLDDGLVMFVSPRVGGGHYHVDQNHISLYGYGRNLLVDTGMSSYSGVHPHFDWQRHQTKSHNTVEVDEKGFPRLEHAGSTRILEGDCKSELFVSEQVEYFKGYAAGYPNVMHNRSVMYLKNPGLYIVADIMTPNDGFEHTYDQCWHFSPEIDFTVDENAGRVWSSQVGKANIDVVSLHPTKPEILVRKGFNANPLGDTIYPAFRQKVEGVAQFYTLLYPKRAGDNSTITVKPLNTSGDFKAFEVELPEGRGIYVFSPNGEAVMRFGAFDIKAECGYIQLDKDGAVSYAVLLNGGHLLLDGSKIDFIELNNGRK